MRIINKLVFIFRSVTLMHLTNCIGVNILITTFILTFLLKIVNVLYLIL